jgi:transcriptional regulator with XRE-family HTH domain
MTLAQRVAAMMRDRGWTQKELAKRSGLNSQTVHNIVHGKNKGGLASRRGLAKAFGISIAELDEQQWPPKRQEQPEHGESVISNRITLASLTEKQLQDGIVAIVQELERRKGRSDR